MAYNDRRFLTIAPLGQSLRILIVLPESDSIGNGPSVVGAKTRRTSAAEGDPADWWKEGYEDEDGGEGEFQE